MTIAIFNFCEISVLFTYSLRRIGFLKEIVVHDSIPRKTKARRLRLNSFRQIPNNSEQLVTIAQSDAKGQLAPRQPYICVQGFKNWAVSDNLGRNQGVFLARFGLSGNRYPPSSALSACILFPILTMSLYFSRLILSMSRLVTR